MGKKILVPCLDVIMIAFFPKNIQLKTGLCKVRIRTADPDGGWRMADGGWRTADGGRRTIIKK